MTWLLAITTMSAFAQQATVTGPDSFLKVNVSVKQGIPVYSVTYKDKTILEDSPLGFVANVGDFSRDMTFTGQKENKIDKTYTQDRIKQSQIHYQANELTCTFTNKEKKNINIIFRVSNNDIAFRYEMPKYGDTGSIVIEKETTGFDFPSFTTTFLCPQSDAMIGWKRTKPSYEEEYKADAPMNVRSQYGHGYTFPCLFHVGENGWALISETGVDSKYCGSHLSDATADGLYTLAFPMPEENNGNGTASPGLALPGSTPWRTITVGENLKPIVETTIPWDVVEPLYPTEHTYKMGRGTWSWILWQDGSINFDDTNIGRERMKDFIDYAHSKKVDVFLWYSSSGYWNDIVQGPTNYMDNPIIRKKEMKWLHNIGVKGIKVDFFGGDKQETMRLYEAILSDADDNGLMVIFHGCTLPRGCMEFGGTFLNKRLNRNNDGGSIRKTTDVFQLATAVLFQNPIQNFALAPNNLTDAPQVCLDFMKQVPTTWNETRFIDGYPGKYVVLARRHADKWYIAGINAQKEPLKLKLNLPMCTKGDKVMLYQDDKKLNPHAEEITLKKNDEVSITMQAEGGFLLVK